MTAQNQTVFRMEWRQNLGFPQFPECQVVRCSAAGNVRSTETAKLRDPQFMKCVGDEMPHIAEMMSSS